MRQIDSMTPEHSARPSNQAATLSDRIIQCWFAGIPCPDLRALADAAPETAAERDRLNTSLNIAVEHLKLALTGRDEARAQRDEALAACKEVVFTWECGFENMDTGFEGTPLEADYKQCKAAIKHIEEQEGK
jgi:hypothetical protein